MFAIAVALVANAPDGLYQLLQQLNGIFFIPIASIIIAGFSQKMFQHFSKNSSSRFNFLFNLYVYLSVEHSFRSYLGNRIYSKYDSYVCYFLFFARGK